MIEHIWPIDSDPNHDVTGAILGPPRAADAPPALPGEVARVTTAGGTIIALATRSTGSHAALVWHVWMVTRSSWRLVEGPDACEAWRLLAKALRELGLVFAAAAEALATALDALDAGTREEVPRG